MISVSEAGRFFFFSSGRFVLVCLFSETQTVPRLMVEFGPAGGVGFTLKYAASKSSLNLPSSSQGEASLNTSPQARLEHEEMDLKKR